MAITSILRNFTGSPSIVFIQTTDDLAAITTTGYITAQQPNIDAFNNGDFTFASDDYCLINYGDGEGFFTVDQSTEAFLAAPPSGGLSNTLASADIFVGNGSNIATGVAMSGAIAITNAGVTSIVAGQTTAGTTSSATPGTIRAFVGEMTGSATTMTSGNLVGLRGQVNVVGASGGFLYGTQGKVIVTGTLSGSEWTAGIFGQVDISAATINAGQIAPIWGDYGASSHTLTSETGMYGIAMTNTTAAVLAGQLYLYGGATTLMLLNTNAGLSGVTYFKAAGTTSGSWGNGTPPTPSKVLTISVDGTLYYLPLVAQNT